MLLPFTRLHDRTRHDGFGLGLALVAAVAQARGGTVDVTAVPRQYDDTGLVGLTGEEEMPA